MLVIHLNQNLQHLRVGTNTFRLYNPSPKSMLPIREYRSKVILNLCLSMTSSSVDNANITSFSIGENNAHLSFWRYAFCFNEQEKPRKSLDGSSWTASFRASDPVRERIWIHTVMVESKRVNIMNFDCIPFRLLSGFINLTND